MGRRVPVRGARANAGPRPGPVTSLSSGRCRGRCGRGAERWWIVAPDRRRGAPPTHVGGGARRIDRRGRIDGGRRESPSGPAGASDAGSYRDRTRGWAAGRSADRAGRQSGDQVAHEPLQGQRQVGGPAGVGQFQDLGLGPPVGPGQHIDLPEQRQRRGADLDPGELRHVDIRRERAPALAARHVGQDLGERVGVGHLVGHGLPEALRQRRDVERRASGRTGVEDAPTEQHRLGRGGLVQRGEMDEITAGRATPRDRRSRRDPWCGCRRWPSAPPGERRRPGRTRPPRRRRDTPRWPPAPDPATWHRSSRRRASRAPTGNAASSVGVGRAGRWPSPARGPAAAGRAPRPAPTGARSSRTRQGAHGDALPQGSEKTGSLGSDTS